MRHKLAFAVCLVVLFGVACGGAELPPTGFADYVGRSSLSPDEQWALQEQEMYDAVRSCMRDEGFDFTPPQQEVASLSAPDGLDPDSVEAASTWGFGASTLLLPAEAVGPSLVGDPTISEAVDTQEIALADLEGLSETEVDAFFATLEGPEACLDQGSQAAFSMDPTPFELEFGDELAEMRSRAQSHPDVVRHADRVAQCLADRGRRYTSIFEASSHFRERAFSLASDLVFDSDGTLDAMSMITLGELQREETGVALDVHECEGWYHHHQMVIDPVLVELEAELLG